MIRREQVSGSGESEDSLLLQCLLHKDVVKRNNLVGWLGWVGLVSQAKMIFSS